MKIGTDGVLLGAWAHIEKSSSQVLDVGTGTGLISLMLAQRYSMIDIQAIEIDAFAAEEAKFNFDASPWKNRLLCLTSSLNEFSAKTQKKYDHIICNPPFFQNGSSIKNVQRNLARNQASLPLDELFEQVNNLLLNTGTFSLIIPIAFEKEASALASSNRLFLKRKTKVRGHSLAKYKRVLLTYSRIKESIHENELTLEISRHERTPEYQALVDNFYLPQT